MMIEEGDPVFVTDASEMGAYNIEEGDKGWASSVINLPDGQKIVFFVPDDIRAAYVIDASRLEVDEERKEQL